MLGVTSGMSNLLLCMSSVARRIVMFRTPVGNALTPNIVTVYTLASSVIHEKKTANTCFMMQSFQND